MVVTPHPCCCMVLHLVQRSPVIRAEPLVAHRPAETLDIGVLLRIAKLDQINVDASILGLVQRRLADALGAIVTPDHRRPPAPLNHLTQRPGDSLRGQREVDLNGEGLAVEVIEHIEQPNRSSVIERVVHKVHRPHFVDSPRHRQCGRLVTHQTLARFDPQIQLQLPLDPIIPLVDPDNALDVAQVQET